MANFFSFENIKYHLGTNTRLITVSSVLEEGMVLLVKGSSGSGKSTLLRILARLQTFDSGQIKFKGASYLSVSPQVWRNKINYAAQKPAIFNGTVLDNLKIPYELKINKEKEFKLALVQQYMEQLLLNPEMLGQDARTLSGGEAARIALLRAVLLQPALLLLDEPTAALDYKSEQAVLSFLKNWLEQEHDHGIILVSHNNGVNDFSKVRILEITGNA